MIVLNLLWCRESIPNKLFGINGNFIPIGHPSFHSLDPCFYSTKVLVRNRHCTWTTHFRRSTNKLTRWVSRTGTMNFNHEVRSLPGTTATRF